MDRLTSQYIGFSLLKTKIVLKENLAPIKKNAREAWNTAKKPVEKAADWMSTLKTALRVDSLKGALKVARSSQTSQKTKVGSSSLRFKLAL